MPSREVLTHMLRTMYRIRFFEERLKRFYDYRGFSEIGTPEEEAEATDQLLTCVGYDFASEGMIGGAVHLSIGQEAVAVGVCANLGPKDFITSSHRDHGHAIAKGCDVKRCLAELMGREGGLCGGFGGSMHLYDPQHGMLGGNGIIGGQIPVALGPAFAAKYRAADGVSVAFFGDGGANQGTLYESLNLALLWRLPALFVCENNLYAASTPSAIAFATEDIAPRAEGFGVPAIIVDGQDVLAVYDVAQEAVGRARAGDGPTFIEAKTYRFEGHCGVASGHQNPEECEQWRTRDPIVLLRERLLTDNVMTEEEQDAIMREAMAETDEAEEFAKASPLPAPGRVEAFVQL